MIARVVLSKATRQFDKEYSYIIPNQLEKQVMPGSRVIVPFGRSDKPVEGYVLDLQSSGCGLELKSIAKLVDANPILEKDLLKLAVWMKQRYICTYGDAIKCMLPAGIGIKGTRILQLEEESELTGNKISDKIITHLKACGGMCEYEETKKTLKLSNFNGCIDNLKEAGILKILETYSTGVREKTVRVAYLAMDKEEILDEIENNRIKRIQQIRVLEMLIDNEFISVADIILFAGVSASVIDTLRKYGYIAYKEIEVKRSPFNKRIVPRTSPMEATNEQKLALEFLTKVLDKGEFNETLLHGVTGSGKTEVYMQFIQYCIEKGKQAIMLVPEIALTPQMIERLKGRFGDIIAVLHSRLSLGERYDQWRSIREGSIKVVVGARSAVFAPTKDLGLIIIDEEHEGSYKSEMTPKYNAREVARERCKNVAAPILYGSATPSVETYYKAVNKKIYLISMNERANNAIMPEVELVDMRLELKDGNRSVFSDRLAMEIAANIENKQQTILFLNRRGHSSFVLCRNCGFVLKCTDCNVAMTYHAHDDRVICHYCGYTKKNPQLCPKCSSNSIRHFGTGTQRIEEELKKQFENCSVIRMDMDTTTGKNSHEEILSMFKEQNINIMVGTQMIAKGHDFPRVTLVGVLAADSLLNIDDYRASERTFQLITQVAGRAGRGEMSGRVIVQSYNTEDFSIRAACEHDYITFYSQEIKLREQLNYSPFTNIAVIILSGLNDKKVFGAAKDLLNDITLAGKENEASIQVYGPARAPMAKIKNRYRWRYILKCEDLDKLIRVLSHVSDTYYGNNNTGLVELSVDINPASMI